jgi:hypothetical protein
VDSWPNDLEFLGASIDKGAISYIYTERQRSAQLENMAASVSSPLNENLGQVPNLDIPLAFTAVSFAASPYPTAASEHPMSRR